MNIHHALSVQGQSARHSWSPCRQGMHMEGSTTQKSRCISLPSFVLGTCLNCQTYTAVFCSCLLYCMYWPVGITLPVPAVVSRLCCCETIPNHLKLPQHCLRAKGLKHLFDVLEHYLSTAKALTQFPAGSTLAYCRLEVLISSQLRLPSLCNSWLLSCLRQHPNHTSAVAHLGF